MDQLLREKAIHSIFPMIFIFIFSLEGVAAQKETAATVNNPVKESELTTLKLTEKA